MSIQPGDKYCRRCGSALGLLSSCPMGCPDDDPPDLKLVDEFDEMADPDPETDTDG